MPSPQPTGSRHHGFHGREKELAWLRSHFDAVAARGADGKFAGPRMAFIVAESGIGKSRLVQELYIGLTNDPQWDPPEVNYWPDAFGNGGVNLRAVPDMRGHAPKGPPRFAWLGARWQSPEERNALARRSVLPEVRSSVMVHAEILKSHGSAWADAASRASESIRKDGVSESIGAAADLVGVPFFGLMSKVAKGARDLVADRLAGPKHFEQVEAREIQSEVDEVLECMRLLLHGKGSVPTVLWLDDAQWIDGESQEFLLRLWAESERRRWPLLVVVTHWEREWRELKLAHRNESATGTIHELEGRPGVEVIVLESPAAGALRGCLLERLPGLTAAQQSLLVEKSGGNFLTMMENIGELLAEPLWFDGERVDGALTEDAVAHIRAFKTAREDRVRQRFQALESEVKKILGWSTQLGSRFIAEVLEEFARARLKTADAAGALEKCVDPYVVLAKPSPLLREFRDKVFHQVATEFRTRFLQSDSQGLREILQRHLIEWVNSGLDGEGNQVWLAEGEGISAPERSAIAVSPEERRELLGMAIRELPIPDEPDWRDSAHVAALRCRMLAVVGETRADFVCALPLICDGLARLRWSDVPTAVVGAGLRHAVATSARQAGRIEFALALRADLARRAEQALAAGGGDHEQLAFATAIRLLGVAKLDAGWTDDARHCYTQALDVLGSMRGSDSDAAILLERARTRDLVASLYVEREIWTDARGWFGLARSELGKACELEPSQANLAALAAVLERSARAEMSMLNWERARQHLRGACEVTEQLSRRHAAIVALEQSSEAKLLASRVRAALARCDVADRDWASARRNHAEAVRTVRGIESHSVEPDLLLHLGSLLSESAVLEARQEQSALALDLIAEAGSLVDQVQDMAVHRWNSACAEILRNLGVAASRCGDVPLATRLLADAVVRARSAFAVVDSARRRALLGISLLELGKHLAGQGIERRQEARAGLTEAIELLSPDGPAFPVQRLSRIAAREALVQLEVADGAMPMALEVLERLIEDRDRLWSEREDPEDIIALGTLLAQAGDVAAAAGLARKALGARRRRWEICRDILGESDDVRDALWLLDAAAPYVESLVDGGLLDGDSDLIPWMVGVARVLGAAADPFADEGVPANGRDLREVAVWAFRACANACAVSGPEESFDVLSEAAARFDSCP
jgi:tetratricopeptide (TPR) repeat protein